MRTTLNPFYLVLLMAFLFSVPHLFSQTIAVDDTIDLVPGLEKTVNLLANDIYPTGDSIRITGGLGGGSGSVISTWHFQGMFTYLVPHRGCGNLIVGSYTLLNMSSLQTSSAKMVFRIRDHSWDTLKVNDVEAVISASGFQFCLPFSFRAQNGFFIPKGSGQGTIFNNTFWFGGLDNNDILHVAAELYRQGSFGQSGLNPDFYAGPVMDSMHYSIYQDTAWNYVWNLKRSDIELHKAHWNDHGYVPVHDILTWPGNGDASLGQATQLAPFHDVNNDDIYDPLSGDCPAIRGDQCLFFIFNDDRGAHLESKGTKLRIEIHGMAYAYNLPGDSAFSKTIFINYKVYNRSAQTYHNAWIGTFTDMEIGYSQDDLIQCDVGRSSIIGHTGKAIDGSGQPWAYGAHPPAQSVTLLAGPGMAKTGYDRPRYDNSGHPLCNESTNGYGFGDGIADNERLGLHAFMTFGPSNLSTPVYNDGPSTPEQYYNYMNATWIDSTHMIYGGNGHPGHGGYGPAAQFMFPGESDTLNWGCGCQPPNGPVNWTETTAGNLPHDISGMGATGPFTFHAGEMQEFDLAFVWARDYTSTDTLASVVKLRTMIDTVRKAFYTNQLPGGGAFLATPEIFHVLNASCNIYPNPARSFVTVGFITPLKEQTTLEVFDFSGKLMQVYSLQKGITKYGMDCSGYSPGLYLLHIKSNDKRFIKKLAVIH